MRLATYNVEWFAKLFDRGDHLIEDDAPSGHAGVTQGEQVAALGRVFTALEADAIVIIEAPNTGRTQDTVRALERFAARFGLRQRKAVMGFANPTHQELALLFDPDVISARHDPIGADSGAAGLVRFDQQARVDLGLPDGPDLARFSKPPMELALRTVQGADLRLIAAHLKSKAPHGDTSEAGVQRLGLANCRKQLAQAAWLRARVDLHRQRDEPVIVIGDLNDGPGMDAFEQVLGRSSVETVLGDDLVDPHARDPQTHTSARFVIPGRAEWEEGLLDYIMLSPDLMAHDPCWRIWHPLRDAALQGDPALCRALLTASDHFPVTLDISI